LSYFDGPPESVDNCFDPESTSDVEPAKNDEDDVEEYNHQPLDCRSPVFTAVSRMLDTKHLQEARDKGGRQPIRVNYRTFSERPVRPHPLKKAANWYNPKYVAALRLADPLDAAHLEAGMSQPIQVNLAGIAR